MPEEKCLPHRRAPRHAPRRCRRPLEDLDDLAPEVGIHGVDLFRTVDLHMGDLVHQLDAEGFVVGHGRHPQPQRGSMIFIL
jgi:hypothetical protein